jgi:hypothetical protein
MSTTTVTLTPGDSDEPAYELADITPETAADWLKNNTHNRNIRAAVVAGYVADMTAGQWLENGQSIRFAADGTLLDGQHRLTAIAESGITVRMLVVRNLPNITQMTMDTGAKRTFADVLRLNGESQAVSLAAACLRVYQWKQGVRKSFKAGARPTHRQLLDTLEQHPEIRRSVEISDRVRMSGSLTAGAASLCHWLFLHVDAEDCAFFFARLSDGAGLMTDDPIYALRRSLSNLVSASGRPDESFVIALVIKAWNFYREGTSVQLIAYRPGGARPESYPEPK